MNFMKIGILKALFVLMCELNDMYCETVTSETKQRLGKILQSWLSKIL